MENHKKTKKYEKNYINDNTISGTNIRKKNQPHIFHSWFFLPHTPIAKNQLCKIFPILDEKNDFYFSICLNKIIILYLLYGK